MGIAAKGPQSDDTGGVGGGEGFEPPPDDFDVALVPEGDDGDGTDTDSGDDADGNTKDDGDGFWPVWVLGVWGLGLIIQGWNAYGFHRQPISDDDVNREIEKLRS